VVPHKFDIVLECKDVLFNRFDLLLYFVEGFVQLLNDIVESSFQLPNASFRCVSVDCSSHTSSFKGIAKICIDFAEHVSSCSIQLSSTIVPEWSGGKWHDRLRGDGKVDKGRVNGVMLSGHRSRIVFIDDPPMHL
jgi:hypothetical protein